MRILVVTDNYLQGGLEKHLLALTEEGLSRGDEFYFAFSNYVPCGNAAIDDHVVCTLDYPKNTAVESLKEDVDSLVHIIQNNNIDVIHAHPFLSVLPAAIAAQKERRPLVFTYHATHSYNFPGSSVEALLFQQVLSNVVAHTFAVNIECLEDLAAYYPETPMSHLPNPVVSTDVVDVSDRIQNKTWALVSRLDFDKAPGIKRIIEWLPELPIDRLFVYGEGEARDEIIAFSEHVGAAKKITWCGYKPNWLQIISSENVTGVIGSDRVALEACSAAFPVVIITLNSLPCGIMNIERYRRNTRCNFNGNALEKIESARELAKEIDSIESNLSQFQEIATLVKEDYSVENVYDEYREVLQTISAKTGTGFVEFLDKRLQNDSPSISNSSTLDAFADTLLIDVINPLVFNTFLFAREQTSNSSSETLTKMQEKIEAMSDLLETQKRSTNKKISQLNKRLSSINSALNSIKTSASWRIGRIITYPARQLKKLIHKQKSN